LRAGDVAGRARLGKTLRRLVSPMAHESSSTGGHSVVGRWIHDLMPTRVVGFGCVELYVISDLSAMSLDDWHPRAIPHDA
jgi:hypothetical protein